MEATRLFEVLHYQKAHNPKEVTLAERKAEGGWITYSVDECIDYVNRVSKGLLALGIEAADTVALISNNRPQWNFVDMGMQQIGAINVPIYPTISEKEYAFIFKHAEIKVAFVSDKELLGKIEAIREKVPSLQAIYTFDEIDGAKHWSEVLEAGREVDFADVEARMAQIKPNDLATIIYTSGTTGDPKGVMLSHNNIMSNFKAAIDLLPVEDATRALSFLPLCHSFERVVTYGYMYVGVSCYYCPSLDPQILMACIQEVKPHFFTTVPRLLEKVYEKIVARGNELAGIKKFLFFWALRLGLQFDIREENSWWYNKRLEIARKLIFSKWKDALGGEILGIATGAAPLPRHICKVFSAAGIIVREGYGLTESSPVLTVNRFEPEDCMEGSVGMAIPGVTIELKEQDEICAKGPNIMLGYYKNPEKTKETIDAEGWLHTGDVGKWIELDGKKFLRITDRIKSMFKTSGGKYVAPQPIQNKFKESFFIEQIMVVGEYRKFVAALVVPSVPYLESWCEEEGISFTDINEVLKHPKVLAEYEKIRKKYNKEFSKVEKIKKMALLPQEWTIDTGELTPTMKLKRKVILSKYANEVEALYTS